MTYEEAHEYLKNLQKEFTKHRQAYANELITANGKAIEALGKQIPKKPKMDNDNGIYEGLNNGIREATGVRLEPLSGGKI